MENYAKKLHRGFTITEAIIVLVIIGFITILVFPQLIKVNPTRENWDTLSIKTAENINQSVIQMFIYNSSLDSLKYLHDGNDSFSIEDNNANDKMLKLFRHYLSAIDLKIDKNKKYFSEPIKDYKGVSTGTILNSAYSNFIYVADGVLVGFRYYGDCKATENNTNPPNHTQKYSIDNICGSIFFDVNAYKKPNKLGSDQYIIPISEKGIIYN